ncbi:MAG TPA: winged helix DNA-binding domain-containing protein [Chthonomonadaceae bacterium]|nr:winged helix DNA-binding domain-containing protein [Chthonomonadaceae bacterium]
MGSATVTDIARLRLVSQRLVGPPIESPTEAVRWFCAVQAQEYAGAKWALALRTAASTNADIDALFAAGEILRTHVMRPTWHFVLPEDIRWLLKLTAPRVHAVSAYYYRQQDLDEALLSRSGALIGEALRGNRQLTRSELAGVLRNGGIAASGIRLGYLMIHAELDGIICSGAPRGRQHTYALLDERAPNARSLERDEAIAELTLRYFASHGPATAQDFAWWSGLPAAGARAGIGMVVDRLTKLDCDGKTYWYMEPAAPTRVPDSSVRLLPNFDEHLVAYKDHGPTFDAELSGRRDPRDGALMANRIALNGKIAGRWRRTIKSNEALIETKTFVPLEPPAEAALEAACARYGEYVGLPVTRRSRSIP